MGPYHKLILSIFIILSFSIVQAQNKKGDIYVQFGVSSGYGYPTELTSLDQSSIPTMSVGVGLCVNKLYHAGFYAAYTYSYFIYDNGLPSSYKDVWKGWDIGIKNTFHIGRLFLKNNDLDLYIGAITGYTQRSRVFISEMEVPDPYYDILNYKKHAFTIGGLAGLKYFITKRFDLYGEIGPSRQLFIGVGASFKLNKPG
jgi:hypothetical protein